MSREGKTGGILKNTFTVGAFTALSRVLGLVREMFQSRLIGAGMEQSAFTLAFAIPNMARKLFGEGALTAAFVPVFAEAVRGGEGVADPKRRLEAAARLARAVTKAFFCISFSSCQKGVIPSEPSLVSNSRSGISMSSSGRNGTIMVLYFCTTTIATPLEIMSSSLAARQERSMIRPRTKGPRSVTRTMTLRPFAGLYTFSFVPKGYVRWAHVRLSG